ncbi:MAG: ABC transporter ATP-binding protein [Deltaproteobacteria bacterium]|nr:ABC transporter ATP-binding protein [Deltaproteobacteria bacterium]
MVLDNVSFAVEKGTAFAILGPSGSGKTTLLALCAGLDRPSSGSVSLKGIQLGLLNEDELADVRNKYTGFVFQTFQLIPSLTALENVGVPAEICGTPHVKHHAMELLDHVGLGDRMHHYPLQLSGGEQQRVAIARAFINRPQILFADEPTGNLDHETGEKIINLLFELNAVAGTTLILVTHDPDLTQYVPRNIQLKGGVITSEITNNNKVTKPNLKRQGLP